MPRLCIQDKQEFRVPFFGASLELYGSIACAAFNLPVPLKFLESVGLGFAIQAFQPSPSACEVLLYVPGILGANCCDENVIVLRSGPIESNQNKSKPCSGNPLENQVS
jgi:hypothetical protein